MLSLSHIYIYICNLLLGDQSTDVDWMWGRIFFILTNIFALISASQPLWIRTTEVNSTEVKSYNELH